MDIQEKLTKEAFQETIVAEFEKVYKSPEYEIRIIDIMKVNEPNAKAICIASDKSDLVPAVSVNRMYESYEDGMTVQDIVRDVNMGIQAERYMGKELINRMQIEFRSYPQLINAEKNEKLLKTCPHEKVAGDMAVISRVILDKGQSFIVTNDVMTHCKMTREEVIQVAKKNQEIQPYKLNKLDSVIRELMGEEWNNPPTNDIYVLTSNNASYGAAQMLNRVALADASRKCGGDCYIIPSSIHEVLIMPKSMGMDVEALKGLIKEVNDTVVADTDILSDKLYQLDHLTYRITESKVVNDKAVPVVEQIKKEGRIR